jgi:hypothetical protein
VPVGVAVSPNRTFVCTASPSPINGIRTSVHSSPRRNLPSQAGSASSQTRSDLARSLISAIYSRRSPSDIIHALGKPVVSLETVVSVLLETASTLEASSFGLKVVWMEELLGVVTEVYL